MGEDDRRKFKRHKKQSVINFQIIENLDKEVKKQEGTVVDCSEGGVRFSSQQKLRKNTKLYIKLDSEDWGEELVIHCHDDNLDLLEMVGSVMWCLEKDDSPGEFEIGTQFVEMLEQ